MMGLDPENWSMMEVPHIEFTDLSDCFSYDEGILVERFNKSEDSSSSILIEEELVEEDLVKHFHKSNASFCSIIKWGLVEEDLVEFDTDLRDSFSCNEEIVVGFKDEFESLLDQLTGISKQLQLISIVGMPGIGKSTLARKVYSDPLIVYHFHVRAWISISQVYNKRDLLIGILRSVTQLTDEYYHEMNDMKLVEVLYKCLKCNRYLVVLDDIWNREAWDDLEKSFPDDNLGSKIMITSRLLDLNMNVRGQPITPHLLHLRFLTEKESVVLLAKKVFRSGIFPVALEKIGKRIAKGCRGLPLAIVVISGLLESKGASISWWKHVAESVSSYIASDQYPCMDTLALSYLHLPQHLRPLFLYFGLFPEDFEIPACRLIWSWVAEGLVIDTLGRKSLEETANDYLMELVKRSLVVVSKTGSDGGIKACRIHDLLRDLCLQKAEEEKFSPRIYRCLEKGVVPSETLELLRVLDLGSVCVLVFPCEILQLVHVRYLAIKAEDGSPPASLSNLLNLQTLVISSRRNITIPHRTWKLVNLRHLLIKSGENIIEDPCSEDVLTCDGSPLLLDSLQTLSQVYPSPYCKDILASATNLRKLALCGPLISDSGCLTFPSLGFSDRLETLKLLNTNFFPDATKSCNPIMFPERLKRLTLSNTALAWMEMWTLAFLPNLEVLKLKFHSCTGKQWVTSDGGFQRLKFLKFQDLDIVQWKASYEHFPNLQRLVVHHCPNLSAIPTCLGNISTLELIEVRLCSDSAAESALDIHSEQESLGNDFLKVVTTLRKDLRPHMKRKRVTYEAF